MTVDIPMRRDTIRKDSSAESRVTPHRVVVGQSDTLPPGCITSYAG